MKIPNEMVHEFSISGLIDDYNQNNSNNAVSFIDFLKNRRPLLDIEADKITDAMKRYTAFDFFDTGKDIKYEFKQLIFHPFFSTKDQFGMGLTVAMNAAKKMSGIIEEPRIQENGKFIRVLIRNPVKQEPGA